MNTFQLLNFARFTGKFHGFDRKQYTASSGGKAQVMDHLKQTFGYERLVMVGDGATDMEACPPAVSKQVVLVCLVLLLLRCQFKTLIFKLQIKAVFWCNKLGN